MNLREDLNALTPRLRRYARALVSGHPGGCERADDLVHATLMRTLGSRHIGTQADLVIRLYATLTQIHRDIAEAAEAATVGSKPQHAGSGLKPAALVVRQSKLTASLMSLPLEDREALLLVALETFDHAEAARILRVSRAELLARLTRARLAMEDHFQARPHGLSSLPPRVVIQEVGRQEVGRQAAINESIASPGLSGQAVIHHGARSQLRRQSHLKLVKS